MKQKIYLITEKKISRQTKVLQKEYMKQPKDTEAAYILHLKKATMY